VYHVSLTTQRTTHRLTIEAPADLVFTVLRDSSHWPFLDGLTVYSERVSGDDADHELRTSIVANGALNSSRCHRLFDAAAHRAEFRQVGLEHPLLRLGGSWVILRADGNSEVTLTHEFEVDGTAAGDLPELMHRTIDEYSRRELEALRLSSERLSLLVQQHSAGAHASEA
jgi:aromatase